MTRISIIILIIWSINLLACDCAPVKISERIQQRNSEFEYVDQAFIGELFSIDLERRIYKIRVFEVFKGTLKIGQIIRGNGISTCEPYVENEGRWLMLGFLKNNEFVINGCGRSRSFVKPEFNSILQCRYPLKNLTKQELVEFHEKEYCRIKNMANIQLQEDIEYFRKKTRSVKCKNSSD